MASEDFKLWIVMRRETKHPVVSETECFGLFESEQEARDAALTFLHDERCISIHEIKPLSAKL